MEETGESVGDPLMLSAQGGLSQALLIPQVSKARGRGLVAVLQIVLEW